MIKSIKVAILSSAAVAIWAGAANAADVAVPVTDWTGFYIGAGGGGSFNFSDTDASGGAYLWGEGLSGEGGHPISTAGGYEFAYSYIDCPTQVETTCGFEAGNVANIGSGAFSQSDVESILGEANDFLNGNGDNDSGKAGLLGTVEGGFDYQLGSNFLIGINGAFNFGSTSIKNSAESIGYTEFDGNNNFGSTNVSGGAYGSLDTDLELGNSWSIGGRAGFLASDSILLFVSGGYVSTHAELSASYEMAGTAGANVCVDQLSCDFGGVDVGARAKSSDDDWLNGYYLGGGVETLLTETISFKMEYRFSDLGSIKTSEYNEVDAFPHGFAASGVEAEANPTVHAVRATVNWRF